jgi:hypothetical protein
MEQGQFFVSTDGAAIDRIPADISSAEKGNRRKTAANKFDRSKKKSKAP